MEVSKTGRNDKIEEALFSGESVSSNRNAKGYLILPYHLDKLVYFLSTSEDSLKILKSCNSRKGCPSIAPPKFLPIKGCS
jgi:hypothetical protein